MQAKLLSAPRPVVRRIGIDEGALRLAGLPCVIGRSGRRPWDLDFQMLDAAALIRPMNGGGAKLSLVLLDACRNNPFADRGLRDSQSRAGVDAGARSRACSIR
jgi:hypothetical protein